MSGRRGSLHQYRPRQRDAATLRFIDKRLRRFLARLGGPGRAPTSGQPKKQWLQPLVEYGYIGGTSVLELRPRNRGVPTAAPSSGIPRCKIDRKSTRLNSSHGS